MPSVRWSILAFFFLLGKQALASNTTSTYLEKDDVTVTGDANIEHGLIDAPVKVEVLTGSYFQEQQYQDLSEGLSDIAGVNTTNTQRRAGSKSALIQGFGENSVLVMIDGTPVSQNGPFGFDLTQISTSDIKKVEVIKGAASALYGSQAMGGVINIITKKPTEKVRTSIDLSQAQTLEGTGGQARNGSFNFAGRNRLGGAKAAFSYRDQEALDLDTMTIAQDDVAFKRYHGSLYLDTSLGRTKLFSQYIYTAGQMTSTVSRPFSSSAFGASVNKTDTASHNLKIGAERKIGLGNLSAILNIEDTTDDLVLNDRPSTPYPETFKETDFKARRIDILYKGATVGAHEFSFGGLIREDEVSQNTTTQAIESIIVRTQDIEQKRISSYEAFFQDTILLGNFEVSPGIRHQVDSNFGSFTAPKINISHYLEGQDYSLKSWISFGTGYRAPSVKERFFTLDHTSVANYIVTGNENLAPEESISLQIGEELRLSDSFSIHGNFFLNQVSGLIETVERESTLSSRLFSYENLEKVISRGVEAAAKIKIGETVSLAANYSYTETINTQTNLLLANRALHNAFLSVNFRPNSKLSMIALTRFSGAKYVDEQNLETSPAFSVTDLKVNYQLNKKLSLYSSLNNVFNSIRTPGGDTVVPIIDDRPSRGQEVFVGLKMELL